MLDRKSIESKLEYLGLDLDNLPKAVTEFNPIEFSINRLASDKDKKIYKYVDIENIEILLTPHAKDADIREKYNDAISLNALLKEEDSLEEEARKVYDFIKLFDGFYPQEIEKVCKMQKLFSKKLPFNVIYPRAHMWNIYYSARNNRYFMLVCMKESDFSEFFYLLKTKIELEKSKKKQYIYVPISYLNYSEMFLSNVEIRELENYMWYFTKYWPLVYEVYNKKNEYSLVITGTAQIFDRVESNYKITFKKKEDAKEFYKLLKAIFTLESETNSYISFEAKLQKDSSLEFYVNDKVIYFEKLPELLKEQHKKLFDETLLYKQEVITRYNKMQITQDIMKLKEEEYQSMQEEITRFLKSRRTFFGKFRYFFGRKSKEFKKEFNAEQQRLNEEKEEIEKRRKKHKKQEKENEKNKNSTKSDKELLEEKYTKLGLECAIDFEKLAFKENITIDDILHIYEIYKQVYRKIKAITSDINAGKLFLKNIERKIANAKMYLDEIEASRRNIFEFWKFTNKDNVKRLEESEILKLPEEEKEEEFKADKYNDKDDNKNADELDNKRDKIFDFEMDFLVYSEMKDKYQRNVLDKDEINSIFLTSQGLLPYINMVKTNEIDEDAIKEYLEDLKQEFNKNKLHSATYDIFGESELTTKVRYMKDIAFRETNRNKFNVLRFDKDLEYIEFLNKIYTAKKNIESAIDKIETDSITVAYKALPILGAVKENCFDTYNLDVRDELKTYPYTHDDELKLIKVKIPVGINLIYYTNIMFFNNKNETLPNGMEKSRQILLDGSRFKWIKRKKTKYRVNNYFGREKDLIKEVKEQEEQRQKQEEDKEKDKEKKKEKNNKKEIEIPSIDKNKAKLVNVIEYIILPKE